MSVDLNLGETISKAVAATLTPDYVEVQVLARVNKLIDGAVEDALRSYSENGKLITAAVQDALRVDRLDLPSYGTVVARVLKAQIEAIVADTVAGQLAKDMAELLSLAPKEVKLSDIAKDLIAEGDDEQRYGPAITVIVERSDRGFVHIYLDSTVMPERDKYRCEHQLHLNAEGEIYSASVDHRDVKKSKQIGRSYGLEQKLRAYVACGTKIIVDEDDVVTSVGDY